MSRSAKLILRALIAFVIIIILLTISECRASGSTIHNLWDALWYALITLTTVGYGDMSPVSPAGKFLGIVLALCSVGILSTMIGFVIELIRNQFLPKMMLRRSREAKWYVFNCSSREAGLLARELLSEENSIAIFPAPMKAVNLPRGMSVVIDPELGDLKELRKSAEGMTAFLMKDDLWANYKEGLAAVELSVECYCMADVITDTLPKGLHLFEKSECLARRYWQMHPLSEKEKSVVLIGCGRFGAAILERALLTNVYTPDRTVHYHVFEDSTGFEKMHTELARALSKGEPGEDSLTFYSDSWMDEIPVIRQADRIILCRNNDQENLGCYERLATWFGVRENVYIYLDEEVPGVLSFGVVDDVLIKEGVMKNSLNRQAILMHEIYSRGSEHPVPWEDLPYFLKQSNIAAADHLLVKIRYLLEDETITRVTDDNCRRAYEVYLRTKAEKQDIYQEMEHRRWMRFHLFYNWTWNTVRNNAKRQHPLLLPYRELAPEEQKKDAYAWEILGSL